jgi:Serine-threonine protein kinase 19.
VILSNCKEIFGSFGIWILTLPFSSSDLVSAGLLTLRSAASFWFSFPNAGEFMRTYLKGRKSVLRTIRKCKFSEILQFVSILCRQSMKFHGTSMFIQKSIVHIVHSLFYIVYVCFYCVRN